VPQSWCGWFGEDKNLLPLPVEHFLSHPAHRRVTTLTSLNQLLLLITAQLFKNVIYKHYFSQNGMSQRHARYVRRYSNRHPSSSTFSIKLSHVYIRNMFYLLQSIVSANGWLCSIP
jgi:hypothetical protein